MLPVHLWPGVAAGILLRVLQSHRTLPGCQPWLGALEGHTEHFSCQKMRHLFGNLLYTKHFNNHIHLKATSGEAALPVPSRMPVCGNAAANI